MNPMQFYQLMLNETNGGLITAIGNVADAEAVNLGMSASDADVQAFKNAILLAYKAGNIPFDNLGNNQFQSLAGWAEVPFECGQPDEQYVYGYFIDNATQTSIGGNTVISELLRNQLAEALGTVLCERPPEVQAPPPLTLECNAPGGVAGDDPQIVGWLAQASATDGCDVVTVSHDAPAFFSAACPPGNATVVTFQSSTDSCGASDAASSMVTVTDTTAPAVQGGAEDLYCMWPPNHEYVCFTKEQFDPIIEDSCSEPTSWSFAGCASDQADDDVGAGDGNTTGDCVVAGDGAGFCVRAERQAAGGGAQNGRRYAVAVVAADACGNSSEAVVIGYVHVPHNAGGSEDCLGP